MPKINWTETHDKIHCSLVFSDFQEAFSFMTRVAFLADKQDHHPKLTNVYNRVDIELSTHDAGNTVTEKDRKLAAAITKILEPTH